MAQRESETIQMSADEIERMVHPPLDLSQYIEPAFMILMVVAFMAWFGSRVWQANRRIKKRKAASTEEDARRHKRAQRPSEVVAERKSQTETVFEIPKVAHVTARTDPATRQVSLAWEFRGAPPKRKIEFWYTDSPDVLERFNRFTTLPEEDGLFGVLAAFAEMADTAQKAGAALETRGELAAAKHAPQVFAPSSTSTKGHVERVLPEGMWFIQIKVETDDIEEAFVYTPNLAKTVREAARTVQTKPAERSPEDLIAEEIKRAVSSVKSVEQVVRTFAEIEVKVEADPSLSASQRRDLLREAQMEKEQLIRKLRAAGR